MVQEHLGHSCQEYDEVHAINLPVGHSQDGCRALKRLNDIIDMSIRIRCRHKLPDLEVSDEAVNDANNKSLLFANSITNDIAKDASLLGDGTYHDIVNNIGKLESFQEKVISVLHTRL